MVQKLDRALGEINMSDTTPGSTGETSQVSQTSVCLPGKYLTFALSNERYGFSVRNIQEIIGISNITRVPTSPRYLKGVINLRGKIIPLIDLRVKFDLVEVPYTEETCIVVVHFHRDQHLVTVGIIVDTVLEVIDFGESDIERAPNYGGQIDASCILGMARREHAELNVLLNLDRVLSGIEMTSM